MAKQKDDMLVGVIHTHNDKSIKIIKYNGTRSVIVQVIETGTIIETQPCHIRTGKIKDKNLPSIYGVGFIGCGIYSASKKEEAYRRWHNMMQRCYCDNYHAKNPTYAECEVCEEWQNYQTFAEWYYSKLPNDHADYQLDKDILFTRNKIYSPDTCLFVSKRKNVIHSNAKKYKFISPSGDVVSIFNLSEFCKDKHINQQNMGKLNRGEITSYKGWTKWQQ